MFIGIYNYPNTEEFFIGRVSIISYFRSALTSLKSPYCRRFVKLVPFKWAEKNIENFQSFPNPYRDFDCLLCQPMYVSIRWIPIRKLRYYFENKDYFTDFAVDRNYFTQVYRNNE